MAGQDPSLVIRIAASLAELKRNLAEGKNQIEVTTAGMQKLASSLSGDKLVQQANNIVAAVDKVGGVTRLTEAEKQRLNATLEKAIEKYRVLGKEAPTEMIKLAEATRVVGHEADVAGTNGIAKFHGGLSQADRALAAMGLNLGPQIQAMREVSAAAGQTAASLGLVATAGLSVAAMMGGWQFGRMIAGWLDTDKAIGDATAALLGWGNVAAETAAAKQDVLTRATAIAGREIRDFAEAMRIVEASTKAFAEANDAVPARLDRLRAELAKARRDFFGLDESTKESIIRLNQAGASVQRLSEDFKIHESAVKRVVDEHNKLTIALDAEAKAWQRTLSEIANKRGLEQMNDAAAAIARAAENARGVWLMETEAFQMAQRQKEQARAAEIAGEASRVAANEAYFAELDQLITVTGQVDDATKAATTNAAAGYAGVAQQINLTADAVRAWIDLQQYSAKVNAILSENPLFTSTTQRQRIANIAAPREHGGPVSAGMPYIVGERRPEVFVPSTSGTILPSTSHMGAVQVTVNIDARESFLDSAAGVQRLADKVSSALERQLRSRGRRLV